MPPEVVVDRGEIDSGRIDDVANAGDGVSVPGEFVCRSIEETPRRVAVLASLGVGAQGPPSFKLLFETGFLHVFS